MSLSMVTFTGWGRNMESREKTTSLRYRVQFAGMKHLTQITLGKCRRQKPNGNRVITKSLVILKKNHRSNIVAIRFHSFNKCLLSVYYALDAILGAKDETVSKNHT